jgi:hypothetical protein
MALQERTAALQLKAAFRGLLTGTWLKGINYGMLRALVANNVKLFLSGYRAD